MKHLLRLNAYKVFSCENSNHKKCFSHKIENYYFTSFSSPVWPFWIMKRMDKQRESDGVHNEEKIPRDSHSSIVRLMESLQRQTETYHCVLINAFCGTSQRIDSFGMNAGFHLLSTDNLSEEFQFLTEYSKHFCSEIVRACSCLMTVLFIQIPNSLVLLHAPSSARNPQHCLLHNLTFKATSSGNRV